MIELSTQKLAALTDTAVLGADTNHGGLIDLHESSILMHMRTTLNLDDELLERARHLTGITEKTALLHAGLEALIARASAQRLAALGATERRLAPIPRRRPTKVG